MESICRKADVLVAAAGKAGIVTAGFTNPEQVILDVGINVDEDGQLCGDVDYAAAERAAAMITPVPGGVGSVTTAVLMKHVLQAAQRRLA